MVPGHGILASVSSHSIIAGNTKFLADNGVKAGIDAGFSRYIDKGATIIHVGIDGEYAGFIALSDTLRSDADVMIKKIRKLGVRASSSYRRWMECGFFYCISAWN